MHATQVETLSPKTRLQLKIPGFGFRDWVKRYNSKDVNVCILRGSRLISNPHIKAYNNPTPLPVKPAQTWPWSDKWSRRAAEGVAEGDREGCLGVGFLVLRFRGCGSRCTP